MYKKHRLVLLLLPALAGCVDGLGLDFSCSSEMREVREAHGQPDTSQRDEIRGDFTEVWYYDGRPGRKYTFRWGVSYASCDVQSGSFIRSPAPDQG